MKDSENQEDVIMNEGVTITTIRRYASRQPQKTNAKATNSNSSDGIDNKRRRLSKQERKALKNINKQKKLKLTNDNSNDNIQPASKTTETSQVERGNCHDEKVKKDNPIPDYNSIDSVDVDVDVEAEEEQIRLECMESYGAIDIPKEPSTDLVSRGQKNQGDNDNTAVVDNEGGCRTLGKWFPNAILIKSSVSYTNTGEIIMVKDNNKRQKQEQQNQCKEEDVRVENPRSSLVLFYQYTTSDGGDDNGDSNHNIGNKNKNKKWDRRQLQILITYLSTIARRRNIGGRFRVAPEGVNATLSAVDTRQCTAKAALRHLAEDLRRIDSRVFSHTDFKYFDDLPADRHFKEFKILPVQELVFYGIGEDDAPLETENASKHIVGSIASKTSGGGGGIHLDAKEYHKMLQKENTVVIDVRNNYETILGRFDGQQQQNQQQTLQPTGAEYIDPKMRKSTDFKSWLATPETQQKLSNKTVLMYCTGGIRCERASAYLKTQMGDQVEGVYQLKGGIERYLKTFKDGGFWRGKNFVFDKREAVSIDNPHGDGGILRKQDKKNQKKKRQEKNGNDNDSTGIPAKCCVCGDSWDRYVGKKKCLTCGVPVLMCEKCMSLKPDKTPGQELKVRCPLCVEENITVLAKEVEFTANGIKNKALAATTVATAVDHLGKSSLGTDSDDRHNELAAAEKGDKTNKIGRTGKVADSVLKWGGGHANKKKKLKKMKRRLCQFGADCVRKDCFFNHPEREPSSKKITAAKK